VIEILDDNEEDVMNEYKQEEVLVKIIRSSNQDDTDGTSSIVLPCPSS